VVAAGATSSSPKNASLSGASSCWRWRCFIICICSLTVLCASHCPSMDLMLQAKHAQAAAVRGECGALQSGCLLCFAPQPLLESRSSTQGCTKMIHTRAYINCHKNVLCQQGAVWSGKGVKSVKGFTRSLFRQVLAGNEITAVCALCLSICMCACRHRPVFGLQDNGVTIDMHLTF
jgi:hypothetical protein